MTYDEVVRVLEQDILKGNAVRARRILDAIGFRQLQQNYEDACVELAKKDEHIIATNNAYLDEQETLIEERDKARAELARLEEREKLRQREWATEKEWADVIEERDEARALADRLAKELDDWTLGEYGYRVKSAALDAWNARGWK